MIECTNNKYMIECTNNDICTFVNDVKQNFMINDSINIGLFFLCYI